MALQMQDGSKHYLLCENCEQYLGVAENYLRTVSAEGREGLSRAGVTPRLLSDHRYELAGINDVLMSRALYGLAIKVHFSSSDFCRIPQPHLVDKLSEAILVDDYSELPDQAFGFKWMGAEGMNPRAHTAAQIVRLRDNSISAHLKLAGIEWILPLTGTWQEELPPHRWSLLGGDIRGSALLFPELWEDWEDGGTLPCCTSKPEDLCPCGSGKEFGDCCQELWCPR
ncbi:SEC-C metal-binding domain-containing protein [Arthrobacter rhombi]|uniref:SEC-C metal-binding domain-containing protein n=1 Tax=Arthrobacter rhombi TaxID=71253 RepID=UPI003FD51AA6